MVFRLKRRSNALIENAFNRVGPDEMLSIENLSAGYGKITAIRDITIQVPAGQIVSIIGANGAGKSTLLKAISGLIATTGGSIRFKGERLTGLSADRIVSMGLSQVAEGRQIFSHMRVVDNIELGAFLYHRRRNREEVHQRMDQVYNLFPILGKRANQIAGSLSGGEQQMLAIARALMTRPELLLLDEPSMGLAPIIVKEIFDIIARLNTLGTTILLVEQNARAALQVASHAYVLETGRVVLEGLAGDLLKDEKVKRAYLGG